MSGLSRRLARHGLDRGKKRRDASLGRAAGRFAEAARADYLAKVEPVSPLAVSNGARRKAS